MATGNVEILARKIFNVTIIAGRNSSILDGFQLKLEGNTSPPKESDSEYSDTDHQN